MSFRSAAELAHILPIFPLPGALLLPRGQMPLNIFEPRYMSMVDDVLATPQRLIGVIQPDHAAQANPLKPMLFSVGCVGRLTQLAETGDNRYLITLSGISRFRLVEELSVMTSYRQAKVSYTGFEKDFVANFGENDVDRTAILKTLNDYLTVNHLEADWEGIENAPNEALINALAMMSPYGPAEKQALLEAESLQKRAEILVALTEIAMAKQETGETQLQ